MVVHCCQRPSLEISQTYPPPSFQGNPHLNLQCFWYLVLVIEILIDLSLRFIISTGKIILCLFKIFINCEAAQPIFIMLCTSIRDVVTISQIGKYALYFFLKLARFEDIWWNMFYFVTRVFVVSLYDMIQEFWF